MLRDKTYIPAAGGSPYTVLLAMAATDRKDHRGAVCSTARGVLVCFVRDTLSSMLTGVAHHELQHMREAFENAGVEPKSEVVFCS